MDTLGSWDNILSASEKLLYAENNSPTSEPKCSDDEENILQGNFKFPLWDSSIISVKGKDSKLFLQSQLTCDLNKIDSGSWVQTSWCAPNGRVKYLVTLFLTCDGFFLLIDNKITARLLKQITIYVLNAEVEFKDVSESLLAFAVRQNTNNKQSKPDEFCSKGISRNLDIYIAPPDSIKQKWTSVSALPISESIRTLFHIRDRYPHLQLDQLEKFLPQELNLDQHLGLSFDKGCYPGQEIIARVKYRGVVKRRLSFLRSRNPLSYNPSYNDRLNDDGGNKVGTILLAGRSSTKYLEILSVLDLSAPPQVFLEGDKNELIVVGN